VTGHIVLAQAGEIAKVSTGEAIMFWILGPLALAGAIGPRIQNVTASPVEITSGISYFTCSPTGSLARFFLASVGPWT